MTKRFLQLEPGEALKIEATSEGRVPSGGVGGALSHRAIATAPSLAQGSVLLRVLGDQADGLPLPTLRSFR